MSWRDVGRYEHTRNNFLRGEGGIGERIAKTDLLALSCQLAQTSSAPTGRILGIFNKIC